MINLLPPKEKKRLKEEKFFREVLVICFLIFSLLSSWGLILWAIKINLKSRLSFEQGILDQRKKDFQSPEVRKMEREIEFLNKASDQIVSFHNEKKEVTGIVQRLTGTVPNGVRLTNFSYRVDKDRVSIAGISSRRDNLLEFKSKLESEFQGVDFPPSSWVSAENIEFSATFKMDR